MTSEEKADKLRESLSIKKDTGFKESQEVFVPKRQNTYEPMRQPVRVIAVLSRARFMNSIRFQNDEVTFLPKGGQTDLRMYLLSNNCIKIFTLGRKDEATYVPLVNVKQFDTGDYDPIGR